EVRELEREADQLREKRDAAEKRIRAIQASLATSGESVVYESKSFKREELTAELRGSARSFRTLEKRLEAKEAERDAKKQGYQLAKENLEEMRLTRDQMKAELEQLRAALELERQAAAREKNTANDAKYAKARESLDGIRKRINVMKEER